jgi:enterochelin esterase-like enzyme
MAVDNQDLRNTRNIRVWLPPGYADPNNATRKYPALYMLDGEMLFDRCTAPGQSAEWRIDETLSNLISKRSVEPLIVIGIDSSGRNRSHEFAPYRIPFPPYDPIAPAGDQFPDFLVTEVMPLVESRYRLSKERDQTGIGGSSLGAAAALYTILHRSDKSGLALLESTSLQIGNGQLIRDTTPVVVGPVRVSIGVGTEEPGPGVGKMLGVPNFDSGFVQLSKILASNLEAAVFNHPAVKLTIKPGAHHNAQYWGERFPAAVQFLYPPKPD